MQNVLIKVSRSIFVKGCFAKDGLHGFSAARDALLRAPRAPIYGLQCKTAYTRMQRTVTSKYACLFD